MQITTSLPAAGLVENAHGDVAGRDVEGGA
jgi:hypothetical protein